MLLSVPWLLNKTLVGWPVSDVLQTDARNTTYNLNAHYGYYLDPSTLVLDLKDIQDAAPVDLFRAMFQSAAALHAHGRHFDRIELARSGAAVFVMKGDYYWSVGEQYIEGQNPVYLIRTLPENLLKPDGSSAFDKWEGGLIGVLGKQMEDANAAARQWCAGG